MLLRASSDFVFGYANLENAAPYRLINALSDTEVNQRRKRSLPSSSLSMPWHSVSGTHISPSSEEYFKVANDDMERLLKFATVVLGSEAAARTWMASPNWSLDDERPEELLKSQAGAREVEDALGRIQHGVFS
jgi:putative toxin-antitoxin system antitoxin component (TIGR02293 family)